MLEMRWRAPDPVRALYRIAAENQQTYVIYCFFQHSIDSWKNNCILQLCWYRSRMNLWSYSQSLYIHQVELPTGYKPIKIVTIIVVWLVWFELKLILQIESDDTDPFMAPIFEYIRIATYPRLQHVRYNFLFAKTQPCSTIKWWINFCYFGQHFG